MTAVGSSSGAFLATFPPEALPRCRLIFIDCFHHGDNNVEACYIYISFAHFNFEPWQFECAAYRVAYHGLHAHSGDIDVFPSAFQNFLLH